MSGTLHAPAAAGISGAGYANRTDVHDEMVDVTGAVRPHWLPFVERLESLGLSELTGRWEEAQHLIRENGITYNVYGDPRGKDRPWQLDPIPLLVPAAEAEHLEACLGQRARLLELILADLFGPQLLLHGGLLPPELVFANPAFLRPCHGIKLPGKHYLHLYAANLGRGPDGSFWCLGDRTQAPSGAGYALENRIVLSRMLPDIFHECRVQRLALFFRALRDSLRSIAPHNRDNPRIVLLTPGPYNETYFEHAYLARYLGYTLVEGADLTVRDNKVFLKVLDGLQPVDVIFRRLDDDYCDPLELRADSFLGVPGLVQSVRSGNVAVANALGSGLIETPALLPFLPQLCRALLGEELRLPSVPTWWCGDPVGREHVLANLERLVIKPTFAAARLEPAFGDRLSHEQLRMLADRIRARPRDFVGQEQLPLSTTPVLADQRLQPRPLVMRVYLAAQEDGFVMMPGGLTRHSAGPDTPVVSMQSGGGSKDTWVLASGPVSTFSLLRATVRPVELSRSGGDLPSRVADNLFWLGRYAERADGLTRLLRGVLVRLTEKSGLTEVPELPVLLRALSFQTHRPASFDAEQGPMVPEPEDELFAALFDRQRSASFSAVVVNLLRVAGTVRDRISNDMWRVLSSLDREFYVLPNVAENGSNGHAHDPRPTLSEILDLLDSTVQTLAAFGGLAMESMTRGVGWRFLDMGRKLERCLHTIGLLRHTLGWTTGHEGPLLEAVLEIADSSMTYRRRYLGSLQTAAVLDLLLADETNPRSLAFQVAAMGKDVDNLPTLVAAAHRSPEQRLVLASLTALRLADADALSRADDTGTRPQLLALLAQLARDLPALSELITQHYLSHLQTSRHLAGDVVFERTEL